MDHEFYYMLLCAPLRSQRQRRLVQHSSIHGYSASTCAAHSRTAVFPLHSLTQPAALLVTVSARSTQASYQPAHTPAHTHSRPSIAVSESIHSTFFRCSPVVSLDQPQSPVSPTVPQLVQSPHSARNTSRPVLNSSPAVLHLSHLHSLSPSPSRKFSPS